MKQLYAIVPYLSDPLYLAKRTILEEVASERHLKVHYPLDADRDKTIDQVLVTINASHLIIADLSFERPSVYFELGLAAASGKNVVIVAQKGTAIHQIPKGSSVHSFEGLEDFHRLVSMLLHQAA